MIQATNITKHFGALQVLKGVSLNVAEREIVSIMGASGAGKTTLLHILGTLDTANSGEVHVCHTDVRRLNEKQLAQFRNRNIGFVFQFHQLLPEFTALENVMMPALIGGTAFKTAEKKATFLLDYLQLSARAQHKPAELSGGEKQRVAVARAMINKPSVILADEPSGSLDSENKAELHHLLLDLRKTFGLTLLIVTHDEALASISDRILKMKDGRLL
ncbi:MAG: ABC transporter ATP-binding protein [Prevotellaceae bacterium]|jgi:lipoprotein-releasing system ATP-binding protein|nr:ABC transporter ATP-binding protein [Prevotellaceae bacterium]